MTPPNVVGMAAVGARGPVVGVTTPALDGSLGPPGEALGGAPPAPPEEEAEPGAAVPVGAYREAASSAAIHCSNAFSRPGQKTESNVPAPLQRGDA